MTTNIPDKFDKICVINSMEIGKKKKREKQDKKKEEKEEEEEKDEKVKEEEKAVTRLHWPWR